MSCEPQSGKRSVAHGVSHGIVRSDLTEPQRGERPVLLRRGLVRCCKLTHGYRRGLQIFRRSAAEHVLDRANQIQRSGNTH